jgi:hypothetical protein
MKKKMQILSLVISIILTVYLCLSYYGIIRNIKLLTYSTEYYINKYKEVPKTNEKKVVVVFSVNQSEIKFMKPFINSLLDQTVRVDDIGAVIPENQKDIIPKKLQRVVNTYTYDKNYDKLGVIIPTILREPENNTKIIIVEPYKIFGEDFIQSMIEKSNENPEKIIYVKNNRNIMLVKPSFFTENFCNYQEGNNSVEWFNKNCENQEISFEYDQIRKL